MNGLLDSVLLVLGVLASASLLLYVMALIDPQTDTSRDTASAPL
jgi:hypothetical protein